MVSDEQPLADGEAAVDCGHVANVQAGAYVTCDFCFGYFCCEDCLDQHERANYADVDEESQPPMTTDETTATQAEQATPTPEPLSAERLAEIRERNFMIGINYDHDHAEYPDMAHDYLCDVDALLAERDRCAAEIEQLKRERDAALEIVRAVAQMAPVAMADAPASEVDGSQK